MLLVNEVNLAKRTLKRLEMSILTTLDDLKMIIILISCLMLVKILVNEVDLAKISLYELRYSFPIDLNSFR